MKDIIETYDNIFKQLVEEFVRVYFTEDDWSVADYYIIGSWWRLAPYTVEIGDYYFRDICQMYEALKNNIPKDKLLERYDYSYDIHQKNSKNDNKKEDEHIVNLVSYALWALPYTKEDKAEAERNIKYARDMLEESIKNNISK